MLRSVACNVGEVIPFLMAVPQPVKVANFFKNNNKNRNYSIKYFLLLFSVNKNVNVFTRGTTAAGRFCKKGAHVCACMCKRERERKRRGRRERER
jgi:hypothetical protein